MSVKSVRLMLVSLLSIVVIVLTFTPQPVSAQVIVNTPTPTMTPTPTLIPTATPEVLATPTLFETPTPGAPVTGPRETFALFGIGSMALIVVGFAFFFLF